MNLMEMGDLTLPWCLRVVVTLGIAEKIAAGISGVADLAAAAKCNTDALRGVLEFLVDRGLFEEPEAGNFQLNDSAHGFLEPAVRLGLDMNGIGGRMTGAWGTMLAYVRTGVPAYKEVFGLPFWEDLEAHPHVAASFDDLMGPMGHGAPNGEFEIAGGWDAVRTVVDVGGGTGAMLAAILRLRPRVRGILVDLPGTVERAPATLRPAGMDARVTLAGQSFFDPLPQGADIYLLRAVINNWADAEAGSVLRRCAEAAAPSGRVVILKSVVPDGARRGNSVSTLIAGGHDRSVSEFAVLAQTSGLEVISAGQQPSGYFVLECRPVA